MPDIYFDVDAALGEVPVNIFPLTDDTDMKTRETAVAYNAAGMDLVWNFVTSAGAFTQTAVTPTTAGTYDWTHQGDGMYTIEIPASAGASINNDTEGYGWFTGIATGVMPWRSPIFGFRAAAINDALCDGGDILDVSVTQFGGTNGTFASGRPEVNASHIAGSAVSTSAAQIGVNVVNFGGAAGTFASGRPEVNTTNIAGTTLPANGPIPFFGIVDMGTAQSYDGATDKLRLRAAFSSPDIVGCWIWIYSSTNGLHTRGIVTAWDNTLKDATIDTPVEDPTGTLLYVLVASPKSSSALPLPANMTQIGGDTQSATDLKDFADAGYDPATNKVQGVVLTDTVTTYTGNTPQTGDAFARLGAPAGASVSADIAAIEAQTDDIGAAGAGLTAIPWNAAWDAEVQSEVADALAVYDPPTNTEMEARTIAAANYATAANLATVDGIVDTLVSGVITGAAATGTLSTTQATSNLTGYADDQLIGRVIIWLTGNCEGEATDITDYASASGLLTFTALTTAPGNGDTFKIV